MIFFCFFPKIYFSICIPKCTSLVFTYYLICSLSLCLSLSLSLFLSLSLPLSLFLSLSLSFSLSLSLSLSLYLSLFLSNRVCLVFECQDKVTESRSRMSSPIYFDFIWREKEIEKWKEIISNNFLLQLLPFTSFFFPLSLSLSLSLSSFFCEMTF